MALNGLPRNGIQIIISRSVMDRLTVFYSYPPENKFMNMDRRRE